MPPEHFPGQGLAPSPSTINIVIIPTRYPIHIGLNDGIISPMEPHGLPTDVETLADILLAAGYSTHAVGRDFWRFWKLDFLYSCCWWKENLRKMAPWFLQQRLPADQQGVSTPLWLLAGSSGRALVGDTCQSSVDKWLRKASALFWVKIGTGLLHAHKNSRPRRGLRFQARDFLNWIKSVKKSQVF